MHPRNDSPALDVYDISKGGYPMKTWLLALGALCVLIAEPQLAAAAVTASLAVTSPNPYAGACPVIDQFKGTIAGTPGTAFTYSFNRFVNGMQHVVNGGAVTLPPSGSITVNDSVTITASALANTFDQIWVHNISGGQPDVYSNKANVAVTCFILPPKGIIFTVVPPAPDSLTNTTDPPTCTNHAGFGGGLACLAGIPNGQLALIWNWTPVKGVPKVDGFNVYRVDGGQHTRVAQQNAKLDSGAVATLALLAKPSDGFNGKCYVVTAYLGKGESGDSGYFCAGGYQGGPIVESFNLAPNNLRTVDHHYSYTGYGPGCGLSNTGTGSRPGLWVGFIHSYVSAAGFTCGEDTFVDQTAVSFNLGAAGIILRNPKASVQSATLTFKRTDGTQGSCLAGLRLAAADWTNATDLIPNTDYYTNIPWSPSGASVNAGGVVISGPNYSFAVSKPINDWAKGVTTNYGWVLTGGNEDTSGFHDNNQCESSYGGFALTINVVISP
jgi:hypothetical protein